MSDFEDALRSTMSNKNWAAQGPLAPQPPRTNGHRSYASQNATDLCERNAPLLLRSAQAACRLARYTWAGVR
jgi:hypothetical protein